MIITKDICCCATAACPPRVRRRRARARGQRVHPQRGAAASGPAEPPHHARRGPRRYTPRIVLLPSIPRAAIHSSKASREPSAAGIGNPRRDPISHARCLCIPPFPESSIGADLEAAGVPAWTVFAAFLVRPVKALLGPTSGAQVELSTCSSAEIRLTPGPVGLTSFLVNLALVLIMPGLLVPLRFNIPK